MKNEDAVIVRRAGARSAWLPCVRAAGYYGVDIWAWGAVIRHRPRVAAPGYVEGFGCEPYGMLVRRSVRFGRLSAQDFDL